MKDKKELDEVFNERSIDVLLFNSRHVIRISCFYIVNLLCCGGHFSNITFIYAKIKYRSTYSRTHTSKKKNYLLNDSPSKMLKIAFYFILNALFVLEIFKFLS